MSGGIGRFRVRSKADVASIYQVEGTSQIHIAKDKENFNFDSFISQECIGQLSSFDIMNFGSGPNILEQGDHIRSDFTMTSKEVIPENTTFFDPVCEKILTDGDEGADNRSEMKNVHSHLNRNDENGEIRSNEPDNENCCPLPHLNQTRLPRQSEITELRSPATSTSMADYPQAALVKDSSILQALTETSSTMDYHRPSTELLKSSSVEQVSRNPEQNVNKLRPVPTDTKTFLTQVKDGIVFSNSDDVEMNNASRRLTTLERVNDSQASRKALPFKRKQASATDVTQSQNFLTSANNVGAEITKQCQIPRTKQVKSLKDSVGVPAAVTPVLFSRREVSSAERTSQGMLISHEYHSNLAKAIIGSERQTPKVNASNPVKATPSPSLITQASSESHSNQRESSDKYETHERAPESDVLPLITDIPSKTAQVGYIGSEDKSFDDILYKFKEDITQVEDIQSKGNTEIVDIRLELCTLESSLQRLHGTFDDIFDKACLLQENARNFIRLLENHSTST